MTPDYTGFWQLLYDWQTIITGALAIIAALIGALAAYSVGNSQLSAAKKKDNLQARCLAVAIAPELLQMRVAHERATKTISETFPLAKSQGWATAGTVELIRSVQIDVPPLLNRSTEQLYLLESAGPSLLQMISVTHQYNMMVMALSKQIGFNVDTFDPPAHRRDLSGQLNVIETNLAEAEKLIEPLHAVATAT